MIKKNHALPALLAAVGTVFATATPSQAVITYSDGDLILGFRATSGQGASTDYLVTLGNAATILAFTTPKPFTLGPTATDLSSIFVSNWFNRSDVLWSVSGLQKVAGNGFANNTMFATRSDTLNGPLGTNTTTPWTTPSSFAAGTPAGKIQSMAQKYSLGTTGSAAATDQMESTAAPGALIQPTSQINSYASFQPFGINTTGASAYGYFVDANGIEGNFTNGTTASILDLYRLTPAAGSPPAPFVGNMTINNAGTVTFFPAGVPEPTTMFGLAAGGIVLIARRRARSLPANA